MNKKFKSDIDKFIADTEEKILAVVKDSIQDVVEDASIPEKAGGKMHVKTGFLRSSCCGSVNALPQGPEKGEEGSTYYEVNPVSTIQEALIKFNKLDDVFYFGWSAHYASIREIHDGFLVSACRKWPDFIKNNTRKFKK